MGRAGYSIHRKHSEGPFHEPKGQKKRVCKICGRRFLPFQKQTYISNGNGSFEVHRSCKQKLLEKKLYKET